MVNAYDAVLERLRRFTAARDWSRFHTPKNLTMAIAGEAGELAAEFQWLTPEATERHALPADHLERVESELADVAIYAALLADRLGLDLVEAMDKKIQRNEARFPITD